MSSIDITIKSHIHLFVVRPTATVSSRILEGVPATPAEGGGTLLRELTYEVSYASAPLVSSIDTTIDFAGIHTVDSPTSHYTITTTCFSPVCDVEFNTSTSSLSVNNLVHTINLVLTKSVGEFTISLGNGPILLTRTDLSTQSGSIHRVRNILSPVTISYSSPAITATSISMPINFDPPVSLPSSLSSIKSLFQFMNLDETSVLRITVDESDSVNGNYVISANLDGVPGIGVPDSHYRLLIRLSALNGEFLIATDGSQRRVGEKSDIENDYTVAYSEFSAPAFDMIAIDPNLTSPIMNTQAPITFLATFTYPVTGVLESHFAITSVGFTGGDVVPIIDTVVPQSPIITDNSEMYSLTYLITTTSVIADQNRSITITTAIDANSGINGFNAGTTSIPAVASESATFIYTDSINPSLFPSGISRVNPEVTAGGVGTAKWVVAFDEQVNGVNSSDFIIPHGTNISVDPATGSAADPVSSYTVTADLPEDNIPTDTLITLSFSSIDSLGITDNAGNPFTPSGTTIPNAESYTLNTDNDFVAMTITRPDTAVRLQEPKVDGNTHEVSWIIEFEDPVTGVDTDGASSQFAINLAGESTSRDSASTDVMVTGSGTTYTARVSLPQSGYPTASELHLTASTTLSAITQVNNIHSNGVSPKVVGDILTDASNDYEVSTGSLAVASITSQTATDRTVVYTITFGARVSNVTTDNFALTQSGGTIPLTGSPTPTFSVSSTSGTNSRTSQSGTFAYEWIVTTTSISVGESPRLSLTTSGIVAEGDTTTITQPTGDDAHRDHSLPATAPTITASDAIRTNNADPTTRGGAVSWDITFDQLVTGVDATHFSVSHDGLVTAAVSDTGMSESRVWRITANLPTTGQPTGVSVALTLNPTTDIRGVGDIGYSAIDALAFTQTYSLRTLAITSIEFTAYANTSASTELTGPVLLANSVDTAVQSPVLLHYIVTYNLPPSTPTADSYSFSCSVPSCVLSPNISVSGNRHIINAMNIPDATGTVTLTSGSSPIVDLSSRTDTTFYFRPRITFAADTVKIDDDVIIVATFSEAITGFALSDIDLSIGGNSVTPAFAVESPSVYSFSVPLSSFSDGDSVIFTITDVSPFVADTTNKHRIFNSLPNSPLPFVHTHTGNFDASPRVATAPIVDTITRVSPNFVSAGGTSDTIAWDLTFDQSVTNVNKDDFEVVDESENSIATDITVTDDSNTYTITATLPTSSYGDRDYEVNLRIGDNNILGSAGATSITDTTSISRPFGSASTITSSAHTPPTHYTLNTDNDAVTMLITRNGSRLQSAKVDGATHEVSWTIEFGDSVTGIDTDGASNQFAINLAGESTSRDSASTDVMVTGSGATYTARVSLPQSSYPTATQLHLTASSTLSAIRQVNNIHNNGVSPKVAGDILTDISSDYQISTGSLTVASITSQTAADRTVVYTITFDARVSNVTADNFALTQSGGTISIDGFSYF